MDIGIDLANIMPTSTNSIYRPGDVSKQVLKTFEVMGLRRVVNRLTVKLSSYWQARTLARQELPLHYSIAAKTAVISATTQPLPQWHEICFIPSKTLLNRNCGTGAKDKR
jgi:hypothetical protein